MALLQGNDIFHITSLDSGAEQQACQKCRADYNESFLSYPSLSYLG